MPGEMSSTVISLFQKRVAEQGGLLSGVDPSAYDTADPIRLWIIQVGVIVSTASLLSLGLRKLHQPKVIAEVIGGIILGPTAFGRIPGFTEHIFPADSIPYLNLVATIGLCLFLFLVGLELDAGIIKRNARLSAMVAFAGIVVPFGVGVGISVPLYNKFSDSSIKFTNFMLFSGVAFSITAFPVLCRILTELKLLDTTVGIVVLSAGVGNDIIGWTLLALTIALVNAGSGVTAVYILLVCVAWALLLLMPGKWALHWLAVKTGSIDNGPTMFFMTVTILLVFGSSFFTDIIGVHAIFGAFIAGLIVPREGGLAIALTEKLEDMVSIIFLPLYFVISGLSTNLGLLDDGITWGYTICIIVLAFVSKFGACTIAGKYAAGFNWRQASTIGSLMSCKGLVELIVLNVGLEAGILSQRVFSMFVLEALVLTFMTTPLVTVLYPPHLRVHASHDAGNVGDVESPRQKKSSELSGPLKRRLTVVLDKLEHLPGMMAISQLIQPSLLPIRTPTPSDESESASLTKPVSASSIDALRLIELSDRVSAVMKGQNTDALLQSDTLLSIFSMFGQLNDLTVHTSLSIVPYEDLAYSVTEHARIAGSDMILVPWLPPSTHHIEHDAAPTTPRTPGHSHSNNPFETLFGSALSGENSASAIHAHFVRGVFAQSDTDVALFVDQQHGSNSSHSSSQHLFLPFFGGPDDRLALDFVAQLCENPKISATVVRVTKQDADILSVEPSYSKQDRKEDANVFTVASQGAAAFPDTVYGPATTETRLQSDTADNIYWSRYASPTENNAASASNDALSRIEFRTLFTPLPLHAVITDANEKIAQLEGKRLLLVTGRSRRLAVENHSAELKEIFNEHGSLGSEVRKTVGDVASAFIASSCGSGAVVVQASTSTLH